MPITKSAEKAAKRSEKLRERNSNFKIRMKMAIKKFMKNMTKGVEVSKEDLSTIYKYIDKYAKIGGIKKKSAARKKSRVAKYFARVEQNSK